MANLFSFLTVLGYTLIQILQTTFSKDVCSTDDVKLDWDNINKHDIESWRLCTNEPPKDAKLWPSVGNGHVATVVHSDAVYMNGLYNGNGTESTRARIPAVTSMNVSDINLPVTRKSFCLQMDRGIYLENYVGDHWDMDLKIYAHRTMSRLLVTELTVRANGNHSRLLVSVTVNKGNESDQIGFKNGPSGLNDTKYMFGTTKVAETPESGKTPVHVYYSSIPDTVVIEAGISTEVRYTFLMSVGPDKEQTRSYYEKGLAMKTNNTLESTHIDAWRAVWDAGRVDIYGNPYLSAATYSSLYYILSAMPTVEEKTWPFVGLSPADLAHNGYNGHIFWDQDTWMFPPILMLNSDLGRTLINTRIRVLDSAKEYARRTSYQGARFPWEGALSGFDVTPWYSGDLEDHITGGVALAFRQYIMATHDTNSLLHGHLNDSVFEIANFWISRVVYNKMHDMYEILEVMPPDEYHFPVNNSVYTNYIAQKAIRLPAYVCKLTGCKVPARYEEVASKIKIPFDESLLYHPEFDGYNTSVTVKQADVILLGWPLNMNMSEQIRRNDLEIYAKVTPGGPAMSWGMFTIGWLEIEEYDKANKTFYEQLKNRQDPFNIWTEVADGSGATNFITGMGGYLHSLIFGYAGIRLYEDSLTINCSPFPQTSSFRLKDVDYIGNSFDITCDQDTIRLTRVRGTGSLQITLSSTGQTIDLKLGHPLCLARQLLTLTALDRNQAQKPGNGATTNRNQTPKPASKSSTDKSVSTSNCASIFLTSFLLLFIISV